MDERARRLEILLGLDHNGSEHPFNWKVNGRPIKPSELELLKGASQEDHDTALAMKVDGMHMRVAAEIDEGLHDPPRD